MKTIYKNGHKNLQLSSSYFTFFTKNNNWINKKVKFTLEEAMKAQRFAEL
jgi:hypothetical protein